MDHKSVLLITSFALFHGLCISLINILNCNAFSANGIPKIFGEMQFRVQRQCACMYLLIRVYIYIYIYIYKRSLGHVWERENMLTDFWWKNLKGPIPLRERRHRGDHIKVGKKTRMGNELDSSGSG